MRIRSRLVLVLGGLVALASLIVFATVRVAAGTLLRSFVLDEDREKARLYAAAAADYYRGAGSWEGAQAFFSGRAELAAGAAPRLTLVDAGGIVVADTGGDFLGTAHPQRHVAKGTPVLVDGRAVGTIMAGSMVDSSLGYAGDRFLAAVTRAVLLGLAAAAAAALLLGSLLSSSLSRRLSRLGEAASRVAAGDLSASVPVEGDEELARLAASFNAMTSALAASEAEKRRIIADSAHELRTPVALVRGMVEAMLDGVYPADEATLRSVHEETIRLSRLIDALRELEAIDSGALALDVAPVDLAAIAEGAALAFGPAARAAGVELSVRASPAPGAAGDGLRLGEALGALVDNALKYGASGGRVLVAAGPSPEGGAYLAVEDAGPGLPEEERERVFERFYRLDKSRSAAGGGRGLGLAIAREIARAHGGDLRCLASAELGGARFELALPARP